LLYSLYSCPFRRAAALDPEDIAGSHTDPPRRLALFAPAIKYRQLRPRQISASTTPTMAARARFLTTANTAHPHRQRPAEDRRLSGARMSGAGLRLYGAARPAAGFSDARHLRPAGLPAGRAGADRVGVQLAAGQGKQHGSGAFGVLAHLAGQPGVYRGFQGRAR